MSDIFASISEYWIYIVVMFLPVLGKGLSLISQSNLYYIFKEERNFIPRIFRRLRVFFSISYFVFICSVFFYFLFSLIRDVGIMGILLLIFLLPLIEVISRILLSDYIELISKIEQKGLNTYLAIVFVSILSSFAYTGKIGVIELNQSQLVGWIFVNLFLLWYLSGYISSFLKPKITVVGIFRSLNGALCKVEDATLIEIINNIEYYQSKNGNFVIQSPLVQSEFSKVKVFKVSVPYDTLPERKAVLIGRRSIFSVERRNIRLNNKN